MSGPIADLWSKVVRTITTLGMKLVNIVAVTAGSSGAIVEARARDLHDKYWFIRLWCSDENEVCDVMTMAKEPDLELA